MRAQLAVACPRDKQVLHRHLEDQDTHGLPAARNGELRAVWNALGWAWCSRIQAAISNVHTSPAITAGE